MKVPSDRAQDNAYERVIADVRARTPAHISDEYILAEVEDFVKTNAGVDVDAYVRAGDPLPYAIERVRRIFIGFANDDAKRKFLVDRIINSRQIIPSIPLPPPPPTSVQEERRRQQLAQGPRAPIDQAIASGSQAKPPGTGRPRGRPKGTTKKPKGPPNLEKAKIVPLDKDKAPRLTEDGKIVYEEEAKKEKEKLIPAPKEKDCKPKPKKRKCRTPANSEESDSEEEDSEKVKALKKAKKWWAKHPRAQAADKRRTAKKVVKKAKDYVPRRNDFTGIDTAGSSRVYISKRSTKRRRR